MGRSTHTQGTGRDVDCADVHAAIRSGDPLSPAHAQHVRGCAACGALAGDDAALAGALARVQPPDTAGLDALMGRVQAELEDERGFAARVREASTPMRITVAAVLAALVPVLVLMFGPRPDLPAYPATRMLLDLALFLGPAALALVIGLRPLHRSPQPRWVPRALVALAGIAMVVLVLLPEAHRDHPASLLGVGEDFGKRARGCFTMGVACAIPAMVWLRLASRDAGRVSISALLAAAAALAGALAVYLHCPIVAPAHLMAGHATILVPYLVLAFATGLRRRREPAA